MTGLSRLIDQVTRKHEITRRKLAIFDNLVEMVYREGRRINECDYQELRDELARAETI